MGFVEILVAWWLLSLTGALAPGPLTAAVVQQTNKRGRLHGMMPMVGHAIVEVGIIAAIIISVQALQLTAFMIDLLVGFGGVVVIFFGFLALKDYRYGAEGYRVEGSSERDASSILEATAQGAAVSILSPYFLLWWFAIGLSNVTLLIGELQIGVGTVFLAGVLIYLTHISTDIGFGAFLTAGTDFVTKKAKIGEINPIAIFIGIFQIALGIWFVLLALI
ncbi:MAG: LysE family transporter [Candidatus Thorarchaeota archaeon]|jgi:threonine/homoserine/homoserine lactone efflux protein